MKILKFGAVWCVSCIVMKTIWEEIETDLPELATEYFDYDERPEIISQWNIGDEIPVFIFLDKNGNEFARKKGQISKQELLEFIKNNLSR